MPFPIEHDFKTKGVYVHKVPSDAKRYIKKPDGTIEEYKESLPSKILGFFDKKAPSASYNIIFIKEEQDYSRGDNGRPISTNPRLKIVKITMVGELINIINGFKKNTWGPSVHLLKLLHKTYDGSVWEPVDSEKPTKIMLVREGDAIDYSSVDLFGKAYTETYNFMQWEQ